jgi:hypothetical protein
LLLLVDAELFSKTWTVEWFKNAVMSKEHRGLWNHVPQIMNECCCRRSNTQNRPNLCGVWLDWFIFLHGLCCKLQLLFSFGFLALQVVIPNGRAVGRRHLFVLNDSYVVFIRRYRALKEKNVLDAFCVLGWYCCPPAWDRLLVLIPLCPPLSFFDGCRLPKTMTVYDDA